MILKRTRYDDDGRRVTNWLEGINSATMSWSEEFQSNVLTICSKSEKGRTVDYEDVVIHEGEGMYLCNDEGKTIEVLSRLHTPCEINN